MLISVNADYCDDLHCVAGLPTPTEAMYCTASLVAGELDWRGTPAALASPLALRVFARA